MTDRPQPPQGHVLVYQELQPDGSVLWMPSIPAGALRTLMVWCPWTGRWILPKYICRDRDAVLCYAENYDLEVVRAELCDAERRGNIHDLSWRRVETAPGTA